MNVGKLLLIFSLSLNFAIIYSISPFKIDNTNFIDSAGRVRIFHGVNIVYKLPPFIPSTDKWDPMTSFTVEDIKYMKKFGFNLVRLGVIWEAVEVQENIYDMDFLKRIEEFVNFLGENGIYTIIDAHQDIMTRYLCGEGIPDFYIKKLNYDKDCNGSYFKKFLHYLNICKSASEYNFPLDEKGKPIIEDCRKHFEDLNVTPDVTSIFDKLYKNENGILDKFISFWNVLALKFKGHEYVLGYDIWNEPFPGDIFNNLSLLIPGRADDQQLLPFYRKIDESIRKIDNDYTMLYEPMNFPDIIPVKPWWLITGTFSDTPLKGDNYHKQVFNIHTYCCSMGYDVCKDGEPHLDQKENCKNFHERKLIDAYNYSSNHNIPLILTEFGACMNTEACFNEITSVTSSADKYLTSWTYWMYKSFKDYATTCQPDQEGMFNSDGSIQEFKEKALTRTYFYAYQGYPTSANYDEITKVFITEFNFLSEIQIPSEFYLNEKLNYPNGFEVRTNIISYQINKIEENYYKLVIDKESNSSNKSIKITIMPKNTNSRNK